MNEKSARRTKMLQTVGATWLLAHFDLKGVASGHRSFIAGRRMRQIKADGSVEDFFTRYYWPGDKPLDHVEFLLKYDDLNLDILEQVFRRLSARDVDAYVARSPTSKYRRRIGFLYEFLTPNTLKVEVGGNFVPVLDPKRYYTGSDIRNTRWRVIDNLLGGAGCCVIVRRTAEIERKLRASWPEQIRRLTNRSDPRQWNRAISYLYLKETKASFAIEREEVTPDRGERFMAVLSQTGTTEGEQLLGEERLTQRQNAIVDPRYAEKGFRKEQNFVGQTLPNFEEKVHYVCPPPALVPTLIAGLRTFHIRGRELPPPVRAAVISFGFVYVHPYVDGNGRLHRLLLHESLARDGYTDRGVVLPFSAAMLRESARYDQVLESVSRVVNQRVRYRLERRHKLVIENTREAEGVWRYLDLTPHVEYVLDLIEATVLRDLPEELDALDRIDRITAEIKRVVDLPTRKLNLLLGLLRENAGKLSARKRASAFAELTDDEVATIETAYAETFSDQSANS